MKKWILPFVLCLTFLTVGLLGAEASPVQEPVASWKAVVATLINVLGTVIAALATGLVTLLLALVTKKFGLTVDEKIKVKIDEAVKTGIIAAEAWAERQLEKPTSSAKLDYAIGITRTIAGSSVGQRFLKQDLVALIEAKLFAGVAANDQPGTYKDLMTSNLIKSKKIERPAKG